MRKGGIFLIIFLCILLSPMTVYATEQINNEYTLRDFCDYWSYGYKEHHIYSSYYLTNNTNWSAIYTDSITGKILVFEEESDEKNKDETTLSYKLSTDWDNYKSIIYVGENIPNKVLFENISADDIDQVSFSEYDMIIIEYSAADSSLDESNFIILDEIVKRGKHIVFDKKINKDCLYTAEVDGSVAAIDMNSGSLLISSNLKPEYFVNLLPTSGSGQKKVTLAAVADVENNGTMPYRQCINNIKILPTYNSNVLTNTFYKWYTVKEIVLPEFVDTISDSCFEGYSALDVVNFDNIKIIGKSAFRECNFANVLISDSVIEIGECAFASDVMLDTLSICVNENSIIIGKESFSLRTDTALDIYYYDDVNDKQIFSPFCENGMEITTENFIILNKNEFILSFVGKNDDSDNNEKYIVTFVDNKKPVTMYKKEVENGKSWVEYLDILSNQEYYGFNLIFKGWMYEDGSAIIDKDIVDLDEDISIYSVYEIDGDTQLCLVNFPEYCCAPLSLTCNYLP